MRWAVLLAGGSGTRFWPLSTPAHPKQLLPLSGAGSTAEEAVERLTGLIPRERILVVAGDGARRAAAHAARVSPPRTFWSSRARRRPRPRSSGPPGRRSAATPTRRCCRSTPTGPSATAPPSGGPPTRALTTARAHDRLVTVGVVPSRPETGYGYIVPGAPLDERARSVARFSEKPDAATALDLMAAGALWNSGLFAWTAERLLAEVARHTPEVAAALPRLAGAATSPDSSRRSRRSRSTSACSSGAARWRW